MLSIKSIPGYNQSVGLNIIEIISVPSIKIVSDKYPDSQAVAMGYKKEMGNLLSQIYQQIPSNNLSLELLWTTHEISNQTFKAKIRLFLLIRVVDPDNDLIKKNAELVLQTCKTTLDLLKYEYKDISYDNELCHIIKDINEQSVYAIVKKERFDTIGYTELPACYSFNQIPDDETDLGKMVYTLINYPNCAVSFQLIPTDYKPEELQEIDSKNHILENLMKGGHQTSNISFSLAEKSANTYKYYSQNKDKALFSFNILIYGNPEEVKHISSSITSQLNAGLKSINLTASNLNKNDSYKFYQLPWRIYEILQGKDRPQFILEKGQIYKRLPFIITFEEAAEFFRLPFGNENISAGLNVNESDKKGKTYAQDIINAGDKDGYIEVGKLKSSANNDKIGFALKDLAKHMLVVGTPGSGKTTFSVSLLDRLWKKHHIPFLVIEPAKNEYRALIQSIPDLQVFTPGKNFISPFVFNPFVPPKNVKLETYKSTLKTAFAAAVSMSTPLDKIFEETINNCYSDFRWLDTYTIADNGKPFNISDFIKCFEQTFEEIGYSGDAKNVGKAGAVRLKSLINLFDNYHSIPIEDLFEKPTIIELAAIENSDQKALIISLLLLSILAYVNANPKEEGKLHNVILLEEAHVLLDTETNAGTGQAGEANPAKIAQGLVKRMLAEIRSAGVSLIIADQSPRKVGIDVVALTDMKMAFRLVEATDKEILADSTSMSETQTQRLAKLKPGEAFFFFNKLDEPEEIVTPDYRLENKISISLRDENIAEKSTYWKDKQDKLRPYPECECVACCQKNCDYKRRILAREIARRIFNNKQFKSTTTDIKLVEKAYSEFRNLIEKELNGEMLNPELKACIALHFFRKIKYETRVPINDLVIQNTIKKIKFDQ